MFQEHDQEITKIYWAIVGNLPEEDHAKLTHYIVRDAEKNKSMLTINPKVERKRPSWNINYWDADNVTIC